MLNEEGAVRGKQDLSEFADICVAAAGCENSNWLFNLCAQRLHVTAGCLTLIYNIYKDAVTL